MSPNSDISLTLQTSRFVVTFTTRLLILPRTQWHRSLLIYWHVQTCRTLKFFESYRLRKPRKRQTLLLVPSLTLLAWATSRRQMHWLQMLIMQDRKVGCRLLPSKYFRAYWHIRCIANSRHSFNNRYYRSSTGTQAGTWLFNQVKTLAAANPVITVSQFSHSYNQPSIIAKIPGTSSNLSMFDQFLYNVSARTSCCLKALKHH